MVLGKKCGNSRNNCMAETCMSLSKRNQETKTNPHLARALQTELDKGNSVIGKYLDLSKAFDTVNHNILIEKFEYYGIRGNVKN